MALAVCAATLTACSSVKLGYNNVDDLTYWWLDRYVDFSEAQTLKLRPALAQLHRWHRRNELPEFVAALARMRTEALADTTPEAMCRHFGEVLPRMRALLNAAEPIVVGLAPSLSPAQIDRLQQRYEKNNATWREDWLEVDTDTRESKRLERLVNNTERFYGTLQPAQLAALSELARRNPLDAPLIYREILRRQGDTLSTLRQLARRPPAEVGEVLRGLLERSLSSPDADYNRYVEQSRQATCVAFAALHNATSPQQRATLATTLASYEDDLRTLASQR